MYKDGCRLYFVLLKHRPLSNRSLIITILRRSWRRQTLGCPHLTSYQWHQLFDMGSPDQTDCGTSSVEAAPDLWKWVVTVVWWASHRLGRQNGRAWIRDSKGLRCVRCSSRVRKTTTRRASRRKATLRLTVINQVRADDVSWLWLIRARRNVDGITAGCS